MTADTDARFEQPEIKRTVLATVQDIRDHVRLLQRTPLTQLGDKKSFNQLRALFSIVSKG